eukprot:2199914-Pyramimonas_sp.AAC.1
MPGRSVPAKTAQPTLPSLHRTACTAQRTRSRACPSAGGTFKHSQNRVWGRLLLSIIPLIPYTSMSSNISL